MCGQSEPKMIRSGPIKLTASTRSSSQKGLTHTCRRKVSAGSSLKYFGNFRTLERSFWKNVPRKPAPFSIEAIRKLGKRSNIKS